MDVQELSAAFRRATVALWRQAGLTRPWNPPEDDFDRALAGEASTVLGIVRDESVVATAMVGHDGHRGWVYYLAVAESDRRAGLGGVMMDAAEEWVRRSGVPKIQLMDRSDNLAVREFYLQRDYEEADVTVFGRWL